MSIQNITLLLYPLISSFGDLASASHCVKSVRIRSYSDPHFSRIRTEYGEIIRISSYSVRMRENLGKMRTRINPNSDTFYVVICREMF